MILRMELKLNTLVRNPNKVFESNTFCSDCGHGAKMDRSKQE